MTEWFPRLGTEEGMCLLKEEWESCDFIRTWNTVWMRNKRVSYAPSEHYSVLLHCLWETWEELYIGRGDWHPSQRVSTTFNLYIHYNMYSFFPYLPKQSAHFCWQNIFFFKELNLNFRAEYSQEKSICSVWCVGCLLIKP